MTRSVIVSAARTPVGSYLGSLSSVPSPKLGSVAIRAALERAGLKGEEVEEVIMGCVLPAALGQAPARQASLFAEVPNTVPCTTVNKVCGSGLKTVMYADQAVRSGDNKVVVAGGMENMSLAPYYVVKGRSGYRMGHGELLDGMIKDGLWDVYNDFHMGSAADMCAKEKGYSREKQDEFATESYRRAQAAIERGAFKDEITPVEIPQRKGDPIVFDTDEEPGKVKFDKVAKLRAAFNKDGTVTAANASSINDGAAAMVIMDEEEAKKRGLEPLVTIVSHASACRAPEWFTLAPVDAIQKALDKAGLKADDIDLWEINEAFSVVTLAAMDEFSIPHEKVNVNGGAVAIGHPIGASGNRIFTTLLYAMKEKGARYGLATACIGGGEASAIIVERV